MPQAAESPTLAFLLGEKSREEAEGTQPVRDLYDDRFGNTGIFKQSDSTGPAHAKADHTDQDRCAHGDHNPDTGDSP